MADQDSLPGIPAAAPAPAPSAIPARPRPRPVSRPADRDSRANVLPRLSIPTTRDGSKIAYDVMQEKVKDKLRTVLTDPGLPVALGLTPLPIGAAAPAVESFPADLVGMIYDVAGKLLAAAAVRAGYPEQLAYGTMVFLPDEKLKLIPPTSRLLDKYFPGGLGRWGDEVALAAALAVIVAGKVEILRAAGKGQTAAAAAFSEQKRESS